MSASAQRLRLVLTLGHQDLDLSLAAIDLEVHRLGRVIVLRELLAHPTRRLGRRADDGLVYFLIRRPDDLEPLDCRSLLLVWIGHGCFTRGWVLVRDGRLARRGKPRVFRPQDFLLQFFEFGKLGGSLLVDLASNL